jgi:hypothetical protein
VPGYARAHRHITRAERAAVFAAYGVDLSQSWNYELDHLIPLELGGTSEVKNLWPEPRTGEWNAGVKDRLENRVHALVCSGRMTLQGGQAIFMGDWIAGYQHIFGGAD